MRTPILFILIPYILSILIIENKLIQKNYFLVFVSLFLIIFIYKILTNFKTKDLINFCIFISLLINLNSSYNLSINNSYIENPPREIIANVEIKTILNKNGKIYYVAEIVDIKNDKLYNIKRVYLSFSSKINKDIFLKRIKIIGILKKEFRNGYLDMYITRCNILEMPRNSLFQYAIQKVKCYILNIFYNSNKNWSEIGNFQKAIFLGDSSSISKDTLNRFKNSGTLHLLLSVAFMLDYYT